MKVTLDLTPEQLAVLDLAFDGANPTEALETSWMMVSEWMLRGKRQALEDLASPLAQPAIANIEGKLDILYCHECPCFPD